jgi:hypothetical protein
VKHKIRELVGNGVDAKGLVDLQVCASLAQARRIIESIKREKSGEVGK